MPARTRFEQFAVILGAGASRGAAVSGQPPLDFDFLRTAQRVLSRPGPSSAETRTWTDFVGKVQAAGLKPTQVLGWRLEQLSTYLEARANMPALQHSAGRPNNYAAALAALSQVICRTLERTGGTEGCPLHSALFELVNPSAVITFNYDLIADQSLMDKKRLAWSQLSYCGRTLRVRSGKSEYVQQAPVRRPRGAVPLIKLHGSINWEAHTTGGGFSLLCSAKPDGSLRYPGPPTNPLVVPPVAAKLDIRAGALRTSWTRAAKLLRDAPGWIVWGYSFPQTDTVTQVLCRTALARNKKPKRVVVINPDVGVGSRMNELLAKVRVESWLSIERFLFDLEGLRL